MNWGKVVAIAVFATLLSSILFIAIAMAMAPSEPNPAEPYRRVKGDYVLMLLQCIVGVAAMLLPSLLKRTLNLVIPSKMMLLFAVFLYCAIYLGEVRAFYYNVPHWDTILHTFSGAMLGALGFSVINFLNKTDRVPMNLSPLFVVVFAFCFALALGVVWEIYEFTADALLHTNMQKFALESGEPLVGRDALMDTMKDLIVDTLGALAMSIIGYISLKYKKGWVEKLLLHRQRKAEKTTPPQ
ncbi:hypothetical protein DPQ25_12065 [Hydrogeniiclostridium mannosilyticum]|uniref:DUF2238 domain-containing protein n=1 Tax=Hydrogeniiclostridium mannosilyticum TaxID=2764322 RepID=A0A328U9I2_9FIRM|nr:hypothetical protein DPQ25_12065 [Hydrogeniiclostridium mannosilyticum]